jgi:pilus assembly protein CpaE
MFPFPFPVVLIGIGETLMPAVRQELTDAAATLEADYRTADAAFAGLRAEPTGKKLFIVRFESLEDARCIRRIVETQRGSPILALVEVADHPENLLEANRAGAMQLIPLPMKAADFHQALDCLALQYRPPIKEFPVLAFTGSAPGSGTTTLATNAAYEIACLRKQHTVLVELAQQRGPLATNLDIRPSYSLSDLIAGPEQMDAQLVQRSLVRVADNFDVLVGSRVDGPHGVIPLSGVLAVLDLVRPLAQHVVLDVPCTYDDFQFEALGIAGQIVLVGEQSISSIRSLKLILDTLRPGRSPQTFHVVMNRYDAKTEGLTVGKLEKALGLTSIRPIPDDRPGVLLAANEGKLLRQLNPKSAVLAGIDGLVDDLLGSRDSPAPSNFLNRFFSVFRK